MGQSLSSILTVDEKKIIKLLLSGYHLDVDFVSEEFGLDDNASAALMQRAVMLSGLNVALIPASGGGH